MGRPCGSAIGRSNMPAKKGKQHEETFPLKLTVKQRESLIQATRLTAGLKKRIQETPNDQQVAEFTKKELEKMDEEIYTAIALAPPAHKKRLCASWKRLTTCSTNWTKSH